MANAAENVKNTELKKRSDAEEKIAKLLKLKEEFSK